MAFASEVTPVLSTVSYVCVHTLLGLDCNCHSVIDSSRRSSLATEAGTPNTTATNDVTATTTATSSSDDYSPVHSRDHDGKSVSFDENALFNYVYGRTGADAPGHDAMGIFDTPGVDMTQSYAGIPLATANHSVETLPRHASNQYDNMVVGFGGSFGMYTDDNDPPHHNHNNNHNYQPPRYPPQHQQHHYKVAHAQYGTALAADAVTSAAMAPSLAVTSASSAPSRWLDSYSDNTGTMPTQPMSLSSYDLSVASGSAAQYQQQQQPSPHQSPHQLQQSSQYQSQHRSKQQLQNRSQPAAEDEVSAESMISPDPSGSSSDEDSSETHECQNCGKEFLRNSDLA